MIVQLVYVVVGYCDHEDKVHNGRESCGDDTAGAQNGQVLWC